MLQVGYIRIIKRDAPMREEDLRAGDYYDVEQTPSTRVYRNKANFKGLLDLTSTGMRMYMYLMYHVGEDAITIRLDESKLCELFECSAKTIHRMKAEMIAHAILAKRQDNEYWINPRFFASNSRISLYPECAVRVATQRERRHGYDSVLQGV